MSNGDCLEWRTSSYCASGECLETAWDARLVLVRDSQLKDDDVNVSPVLSFTPSAWTAFITEVRRRNDR